MPARMPSRMPSRDRVEAGAARRAPLAPPWAARVAVVALLVGALLAGLVWHATRLDPVDAWVYRWQVLAYAHADGVAAIVSATLHAGGGPDDMVAGAALAWLAGRRDAALLAVAAAPATLAAEVLLKRLVHRQWHGRPGAAVPFGPPRGGHRGGHDRRARAPGRARGATRPRARRLLGGGFVLVIAAARLVETVHSLTDLLGGAGRRPQRYAHLAGDRLAWAGRRSRRTGRSASLGRPLPARGRRLRGVVAHRQLAPTAVIEPSEGQRA